MVETAQDRQQAEAAVAPIIAPVTGRTPYDALSELFSLLGRALPWVTVLALFLYTTIEIGRSYQDAQVAVTREHAARVEALNKLLHSNFSELEKLRKSQMDGLGDFIKLNASVMEAVTKNQTMLGQARDETAAAREQQEKVAVAERNAKRELELAQSRQNALEVDIASLQRKIWVAEGLIDSATRLTSFIAHRNTGQVSLERSALSRRFENSSPDAIVRDGEGRLFYGLYRIPGAQVGEFLRHLPARFPHFAQRLEDAGGAQAAKEGLPNFRFEWMSLSRDADFIAAQDNFVDETRYQPFVDRIRKQAKPGNVGAQSFDPDRRSKALQAVLWSVAVQHGQGTPLVIRAFDGLDAGSAADEALIGAIYQERRRIERYYPDESDAIKTLLAARYVLEEELAHKMLAQQRGTK